MTISHDPVPIAPVVGAARPHRRIVGHLLRLAVLGGLAAALYGGPGAPDCRTAASTAPPARTVRVCEREYARTGDPATGLRLAEAHRGAGDPTVASAIARGLLATPARGDALRLIGDIAVARRRPAAALEAFERARALHLLDGQSAAIAGDDAAIARVRRALSLRPPAAP